jgi:hypothetical protein
VGHSPAAHILWKVRGPCELKKLSHGPCHVKRNSGADLLHDLIILTAHVALRLGRRQGEA